MSVRSLSVHALTLTTVTRTASGGGSWSDSESDATVQGRIRPTTAREQLVWAGQPQKATHIVYVPAGTSVTNVQKITYGSRSFRILGQRDVDELGRYTIVECEEID